MITGPPAPTQSIVVQWHADRSLYLSLLPIEVLRKLIYPHLNLRLPWALRDETAQAVRKFNGSVWECVCWLESTQLAPTDQSLARFLTEAPGLSRVRIGELLAGEVLTLPFHYVSRFRLANTPFPQAMYRVLATFDLPPVYQRKAEVISRLAYTCASLYCKRNPQHPFSDTRQAESLARSAIYLKHSRAQHTVPSKETWIASCSAITFAQDSKVNREKMLSELYDLYAPHSLHHTYDTQHNATQHTKPHDETTQHTRAEPSPLSFLTLACSFLSIPEAA